MSQGRRRFCSDRQNSRAARPDRRRGCAFRADRRSARHRRCRSQTPWDLSSPPPLHRRWRAEGSQPVQARARARYHPRRPHASSCLFQLRRDRTLRCRLPGPARHLRRHHTLPAHGNGRVPRLPQRLGSGVDGLEPAAHDNHALPLVPGIREARRRHIPARANQPLTVINAPLIVSQGKGSS